MKNLINPLLFLWINPYRGNSLSALMNINKRLFFKTIYTL